MFHSQTISKSYFQPRREILAMFSKFLILSQGKPLFYGRNPTDFFEKVTETTCPVGMNAADFIMDSVSLLEKQRKIVGVPHKHKNDGPTATFKAKRLRPSERPNAYIRFGFILKKFFWEFLREYDKKNFLRVQHFLTHSKIVPPIFSFVWVLLFQCL